MSGPMARHCPFCGGDKFQQNTKAKGYFIKKAAERAGKDTSNHLIRCTKCGAKGPLKHSEVEAIAAWNQRTPLYPDPSELVQALGKAAARLAMCSLWIENSFNASGTLRAERAMKAKHMCEEAAAALSKWEKASKGDV